MTYDRVDSEETSYELQKKYGKVKVNVISLNITDLSLFQNTYEVNLTAIQCVKEASCLGGVYNLILASSGLESTKGLGGVHILDISGTVIDDVSELKDVYSLNISGCRNVKDFSKLTGNNELFASYTLINDTSNLGHLSKLVLINCYNLKALKGIEDVKYIEASGCKYLKDVSGLKNNHNVHLEETAIETIEELTNVAYLNLVGCEGLTCIENIICDKLVLGYSGYENIVIIDSDIKDTIVI